jgi:hypothetical protein
MGRAFRIVKRTAHLTVAVTERPSEVVAAPAGGASESTPKRPRGAKPKARPATNTKKPAAKAKSAGKKKAAAKA